jgi:hypothetical protein
MGGQDSTSVTRCQHPLQRRTAEEGQNGTETPRAPQPPLGGDDPTLVPYLIVIGDDHTDWVFAVKLPSKKSEDRVRRDR